MAFLDNIEQIRAIEWSKNYLWDVRFTGQDRPPEPFNAWFPAVEVEDGNITVTSFGLDSTYLTNVRVPQRTADTVLTLTFVDDAAETLFTWFTEWVYGDNGIFSNDGYVTPLVDLARTVEIMTMDSKRETIRRNAYFVYPEGNLNFQGNSESGPKIYSVTLVKVGNVGT